MGCTESKSKDTRKPAPQAVAVENAHPKYDAAQAELKEMGKVADEATMIEAARGGDVRTVRLCLEAGVDPNGHMEDALQRTALHYAAERGYEDVVNVLIEHKANVSKKDAISETAMHLAASGAHPGVINILAKHKKELINAVDGQGQTPIFKTVYMAEEKGSSTVETLVRLGADVNARDKNNATTLHLAVNKNNRSTITHALIKLGASINAQDEFGATPLHRAAQEESNNPLSILLSEGADPNIKDSDGRTPLDVARRWGFTSTASLIEKKM